MSERPLPLPFHHAPLALIGALLGAVLAMLVGERADIAPPGVVGTVLAGVGAVLAVLTEIDLAEHRLPNALVLPTLAGFLLVAAAGAVLVRDGAGLVRALVGGLVAFGVFAVTALLAPDAVGGGDIKLVALTGAVTAWLGWEPYVLALASTFLTAGGGAALLLAARRASRSTRLAFGPFLALGVVLGPFLAA
ncbi:prepilin peptidase [Microbacterium gorillae]|uniref:prepilin peptidase n=1 Tax=Microbacterium gorillae TaxID=1231063 RepID=UPI0006944F42|nr:A24 family peptidase [Microbacterium gorillae]